MSEKQQTINDVDFDRVVFRSKSRTLVEAREKDKTTRMGDVNELFRKTVEQTRKPVVWPCANINHKHPNRNSIFHVNPKHPSILKPIKLTRKKPLTPKSLTALTP